VPEFEVDGRLCGEEAGEGTPVVLLHGLTATRRYVVMGSRALERSGHRVVAYDARGHGRSAPHDAYDYASLAADLEAVLDDRGIEHAVLAGASMGAHTIVRFALDHPERVTAACLITPAHEPGEEDDAERLARWDRLAEGLRSGGVDGFVEAYGEPAGGEAFRETVLKVLHQRLSAHEHPEAVADALQQVPRSAPFAQWSDLADIEAPTIVVASRDEADPGHPLATGRRWAELIPGAECRTEDEGSSPLAWQGGQLSKVIAELAARA
jgi:pimeloyl-ACP methyl ester carboxylesterase